jgi:hypothetical protein
MATKTFTSGEILTAADTNTYLANSGSVLLKTQTIGNGVSSVQVTDAFSSTYDNYFVQITNCGASASTFLRLRLGAKVTGYQFGLIFNSYNNVTTSLGSSTATYFEYVAAMASSQKLNCSIPINGPNIASHTAVGPSSYADAGAAGTMNGIDLSTTQYTDFTISPASGTFTGGTIRVYGYRK